MPKPYIFKIVVREDNPDRARLEIHCGRNPDFPCGVPLVKHIPIEEHDKLPKGTWAWNGQIGDDCANTRPSVWCQMPDCGIHFTVINGKAVDH